MNIPRWVPAANGTQDRASFGFVEALFRTMPVTDQHVHPAALDPEALLADCDVSRGRRSGPGGQHRNKVETAVTILHRSSGIKGEATERRSQAQNRAKAIVRLRLNLAIDVRLPLQSDSVPSELWRSRCRGGRIAVSATHADFPALLAEALDFVLACGWDVKAAAGRLDSTASQLTKFLKTKPRAIGLVNAKRSERGLRPLK